MGSIPSNQPNLSEEEALESVANLNIAYNGLNVFFKYKGVGDYISPPDLPLKIYDPITSSCVDQYDANGDIIIDPHGYGWLQRCERSGVYSHAQAQGYVEENSFNVYVPYAADFGGEGQPSNTTSIITYNALSTPALVHEVGHNFRLWHTQSGYLQGINQNTCERNENCEHVTRDVSDSNYNANDRGDFVVDTAAVPDFVFEFCYRNGYYDPVYDLILDECIVSGNAVCFQDPDYDSLAYFDEFCNYISGSRDCQDVEYVILESDWKNFMSYSPNLCKDNFTVGQEIRMRETIANDSGGRFSDAETSIATLYEPYKGSYYFAGPNLPVSEKPLLQPGFDYEFIECSGYYPQPLGYNENFSYNPLHRISGFYADEQDYGAITHPNHSAIRIEQVEIALGHTNVQKCYNNFNKSPKGGKYTKFNDGVFNTNVTIQVMDSLQINNPNMIDNLQPGLYSIEKEYDNGAKEETVIIKGN
jgi:hypothetical protein